MHFSRVRLWSHQFPLLFLYCFAIFTNLCLRSQVPIQWVFLSGHDDQLGIQLAANIMKGEWNNRALAKPPGYSIYLVIAHYIPIPLVVLNQFLFASVSLLIILTIRGKLLANFRYNEILSYGLFVYLIFQPIRFRSEANRIYRSSTILMIPILLYSNPFFFSYII